MIFKIFINTLFCDLLKIRLIIYKNVKIVRKQDLRKAFDEFYIFVTPRVLKIEHFFFLQLIANKKLGGVTIYR